MYLLPYLTVICICSVTTVAEKQSRHRRSSASWWSSAAAARRGCSDRWQWFFDSRSWCVDWWRPSLHQLVPWRAYQQVLSIRETETAAARQSLWAIVFLSTPANWTFFAIAGCMRCCLLPAWHCFVWGFLDEPCKIWLSKWQLFVLISLTGLLLVRMACQSSRKGNHSGVLEMVNVQFN